MTKKQKEKTEKAEEKMTAEAQKATDCNDRDCPFHGKLKARGRTFEGKVTKKLPRRISIEFERMVYVRKYERYTKSRTKIHARLPKCMEPLISVGDLVKVQECRPLSKIINFVVIGKVKEKIK